MSGIAPIILVSPDMRPSIMGVARSLSEADLLQRFVTTVALKPGNGSGVLRYVPTTLQHRYKTALKGRKVPNFLDVPVETYPVRELLNQAARRSGLSEIASHMLWQWSETNFDKRVAKDWAGRAPVIYGCEHASVDTFRRQKELGGMNILWQVIAHHRTVFELLREEYEKFPEVLTPYLKRMFGDAERIHARKDQQFESADLIVTNSEFSRQTFLAAGISTEKVVAVTTGCPPIEVSAKLKRPEKRMIFLSAGTQSVRKGIPYLLQAWRKLSPKVPAELWLIGKVELPKKLVSDLPDNVFIKPPVSHAELRDIFSLASVLVLPTLAEGLAHIILESISNGLAIITTDNSGCGSFVEDGVNGWRVPIRDADSLADRISWCLERPDEVAEMGQRSLAKAMTWQVEDFMAEHAKVIGCLLKCRAVN